VNQRALPLVALAISHIGLVLGLALTYGYLPPVVASHFNATGTPDGWMSRAAYLSIMAAVAFGVSALALGTFYCIHYFPSWMINLPQRDYWLAPERRAATSDELFRAAMWLASLETIFILCLHLFVVAANSAQPPRLSSQVWFLLAGFLLATLIWTIALIRRFRNVT
jgi:uncharacterized membrane protein